MRYILTVLLSLALAGPALAVDQGDMTPADYASGLVAARGLINTGDYHGAVEALKPVIGADANNTDALNLMGFALRKSGDTARARGFYLKALSIDPDHRGANEYLGELYVETGDLGKAREQLAILQKLCPGGCEERSDLDQAIKKASD